ncbi:MAG: nuclear transport factor 2 family protein [Cyanobacteria bacterium P01_G01_bin.38]
MELAKYESIVVPLHHYAQGAVEGKSSIMQQGFYPLAQIYGYLDGELLADPIQTLYDYVDQHAPAADLKYVIRSVDRSGGGAVARVEINHWHGHTFTDFFTLLEIGNEWKIINKIFVQH